MSRAPRQPRAPREPRANGVHQNGLSPLATIFVAPGGGAPTHGPRSHYARPAAAPPPATPPAPAPAAAAPAPAPAPAAAPEPPPQPPLSPDADNANRWRQQQQARDDFTFRHSRNVPQGERSLYQLWMQVLRVRRLPPAACTIEIRRVEPAPMYDLLIYGDAIAGEHPYRALEAHLERQRRQPNVPERFVGRINALNPDGSYLDLGYGEVYLAPQVAPAPGQPWGQPPGVPPGWGAPGPWPSPGFPPSGFGSYFAPPGSYGAPPGYGPPPGYPWPYPPAPQAAPQLPPPPQSTDPIVLKMWADMVKLQMDMFARMGAQAPPIQAQAQSDPFGAVDRIIGLADKLVDIRHPPAAATPTLGVTTLADGTPIIHHDGVVNEKLTEIMIGKSVLTDLGKTLADRFKKPAGEGASHGPRRTT